MLNRLSIKQRDQVSRKVWDLKINTFPNDSKKMEGSKEFYRVDIGEYRIIYKVNLLVIDVALIGKRNDDEVYRKFKRLI